MVLTEDDEVLPPPPVEGLSVFGRRRKSSPIGVTGSPMRELSAELA